MSHKRERRNVSRPSCYKLFNDEGKAIQQSEHEDKNMLSLQYEIAMADTNKQDCSVQGEFMQDHHDYRHSQSSADTTDNEVTDNEAMDNVEIHAPTEDEDDLIDDTKTPQHRKKLTKKGKSTEHHLRRRQTARSLNPLFSASELEVVRKQNQQATKLLEQQELQVQITQQELEAQEKKLKALKLQQQASHMQRKAQQEKERYEKEIIRTSKPRRNTVNRREIVAKPLDQGISKSKKQLDDWLKTERTDHPTQNPGLRK